MAPPIVDANETTVFLNSRISAANLFSAFDLDDEIVSYRFLDFRTSPETGGFELDGVALGNGEVVEILASELDRLVYVGGPRISRERFSVVARDSVGNFSAPAIGELYTVRTNTTQPFVIRPDVEILANESIPATSFISGFDPDGYPLTHFRISEQTQLRWLHAVNDTVTAVAHLHNFKSGDQITITGANETAFNVTANVAVINEHIFKFVIPGIGTQNATGSLLAANDDLGRFELDGIVQDHTRPFIVTADQLERLVYTARGPNEQETIFVQGFDGVDWSFEKRGLATINVNANRPVVQFGNVTTPARQLLPLDGSFVVTDADQNTIKDYFFFNTSPHAQNGDLIFKGVVQPRVEWFQVPAEDLDELFFTTNRVGFEQQIRVIANDGRHNSAPGTLLINSGRPIIRPTVDTGGYDYDDQLEVQPIAEIFRQTDEGNPHTLIEVLDANPELESGRFRIRTDHLPANQIHQFSIDEFRSGRVDFETGEYANRHRDDVLGRTFNGDQWSRWERITIRSEPELSRTQQTGNNWPDFPQIPVDALGRYELTFSFMQLFPDYETGEAIDGDPLENEHFERFTEGQRIATRQAFATIEAVTNIRFIEVADTTTNVFGGRGGIFRFGEYGLPADQSNAQAFAFFPSDQPQAADIWINRQLISDPTLQFGGPGFTTLIHEMLHALGYGHVFDGDSRVPPTLDNDFFSVLSGPFGSRPDFLSPTSPQLYDIESLQTIYGENTRFNSGDTLYDLTGYFADRPDFNNDGLPDFAETIWDGGGNDTLSAADSRTNSVVDLTPGAFSSINGFSDNISIAYRAEIENAIGSDNNDRLIGNHLDNRIEGGLGNDVLSGFSGNDTLLGGAGDDTYIWGVADHDDLIDEQGLAGRDTIAFTEFPGFDSLEEDLRFELNGNDLTIDLRLDGGDIEGSLTVNEQLRNAFRVETLDLNGTRISLPNLTSQIAPGVDTFRVTNASDVFGQLVVPV